ncbi:MAG TPA: hypothetical protein VEL07_08145 [Planctomycetota bacterium]|nr:hypothetical protein [Planctomycetota bacterium]
MSRLGYLILSAALLALAAYVFWPERAAGSTRIALWTRDAPEAYTLRAQGVESRVVGDDVTVDGRRLPLDRERAQRLWSLLGQPAIDPAAAVDAVGEDQLASFGIDGDRALEGDGVRLSWGTKDGRAYAWLAEQRRVLPIDASFARRLAAAWVRLDGPPIPVDAVDRLTVDGLELQRDAFGAWCAPSAPERPAFTTRVNALLALLGEMRIDALSAPPVGAGEGRAIAVAGHRAVFVERPAGAVLAIDDLPPQPLAAEAAARWASLFAGFAVDYLLDIPGRRMDDPIEEVVVRRGAETWFRLERRGNEDVKEGRSAWDLIWPGGRITAIHDGAQRLEDAFRQVTVSDVRRRADAAPLAADAVTIDLVGQLQRAPIRLELAGGEAASVLHRGRVARLPPILAELSPDAFLDPTPIARAPARLDKLQRVWRDGESVVRGEVFAREATGWAQIHPSALPVDQVAVEALARALCTARAERARLADVADRALVDRATFEIACRFAPRAEGRATDAAALDETASLETSLAFARVDGAWRAIDPEGALRYDFADDVVDALMRPLAARTVWPLTPNPVGRVSVARSDGSYVLMRLSESEWRIEVSGEEPVAGDGLAVMRWLRALAGLTAERVDRDAAALANDERVGVVSCFQPAFERGDERLSLAVGRPGADGLVPVSVDSSHGSAAPGRFVVRVPVDDLLPPRQRFLPR